MKKSWSEKDSDCWVKERETLTYHIGFKIHNPSWIIKEMKTRHSADKMVTMPSTRITGSLDSLANQLLRITSRVSLSSDGIPTIFLEFTPTREIIITGNNYNIAWSSFYLHDYQLSHRVNSSEPTSITRNTVPLSPNLSVEALRPDYDHDVGDDHDVDDGDVDPPNQWNSHYSGKTEKWKEETPSILQHPRLDLLQISETGLVLPLTNMWWDLFPVPLILVSPKFLSVFTQVVTRGNYN